MGFFDLFRKKSLTPVSNNGNGWLPIIHEPYTGAWQKNDELKRTDLTHFHAVFACVSLEIAGLANGYQSVYLEDTPLQNDNGEFNFPNVKVDLRTGTNDQEYIDGFPDVASETAVNVELKHGTPFVKAFNNLDLDALRVRLKWGALRQQNRENGDVSGVKIDYAIDVKTDNGGWVEALNTSINAKTSDAYERSHRIDLPKAQTGWQLRVRRITPNSTSEFISDKMYIAAISEVIDLKLLNGIGGRVGTSESKIATLERTTSDTNQALATAQSQLNTRFDGLKIGGRNLILGSQISRTTHGTTNLAISQNIDFGNVTHLVLSCDVRFANAVRATTQGAKWFRIGAEIRLIWTDGTSNWYGAWRSGVANGTSFDGRVEHKIAIPAGKTLRTIDSAKIQIWDITGENLLVKNPKLELGNVATDWTPAPEDTQSQLDEKASTATLDEFKRTQATKDTATTQKLSQLESGLGTKANTTALNELNTRVTQVDNKITAEANKVNQLQTTLNGQTTSIRNVEQSVNGVRAIKAVTVDNNGFISGYGLMSELQDGRVTSRFGINADQIYFGGTTSAKKPFVFTTRTTVIDGVSYPAGAWLNSASIANASITNAHLANATITSAKIANGAISNAHIANGSIDNAKIANGAITSAKIGTAQIGTLQIAGESVIVPRSVFNAGTRRFTQGGDIEIAKATIDAMGGNIIISMGFARLFSIPNGAYSWGSFQPAVESPDFHNFVHTYADSVLGYRWCGTQSLPNTSRFALPVLASDGKVSKNEA